MSAKPRRAATKRKTAVRVDGAALMKEAEHARRRAYAPYSHFPVGSALLARDGTIILGCNVENASYGLTVCAERNAVFQAVVRGIEDFVAIAVTAREGKGAPPCGACRQVLHEFAPQLRVIWRNSRGALVEERLDQLLPHAFVLKTAPKTSNR